MFQWLTVGQHFVEARLSHLKGSVVQLGRALFLGPVSPQQHRVVHLLCVAPYEGFKLGSKGSGQMVKGVGRLAFSPSIAVLQSLSSCVAATVAQTPLPKGPQTLSPMNLKPYPPAGAARGRARRADSEA